MTADMYVGAKDALYRMAPAVQVVVPDAHAYLEWVGRTVKTSDAYVYTGRTGERPAPVGWVTLSSYLRSFTDRKALYRLDGDPVGFEEAVQYAMNAEQVGADSLFLVPPGWTVDERTAVQFRRMVDKGVVDLSYIRAVHFVQEGEPLEFGGPLSGLVELVDEREVTDIRDFLDSNLKHLAKLVAECEPIEVLLPYFKSMNRAQVQAALAFSYAQYPPKRRVIRGEFINLYRMLKLGWPPVEPVRLN